MPWVAHGVRGWVDGLALSFPLSDCGTASPQMEGSVGRPRARFPHSVSG